MSVPSTVSSRAISADSLVSAAFDHAPEDRDGFLVTACGDDTALLAEVRGRLAARESLPSWAHDISAAEGPTVRVSPSVASVADDRIDRYKLLQRIGEGGFGVVWMAEQMEPVSRRVALKIIKLGMDTREVIARFEQERQALAMMDHRRGADQRHAREHV